MCKCIVFFVVIEFGARASSVGGKIVNERGDVVGDVIVVIEDEDVVLGLVCVCMSFICVYVVGELGLVF